MLTADVDPSHKDSSGVLMTVCASLVDPSHKEGMLVLSSIPTTTHM